MIESKICHFCDKGQESWKYWYIHSGYNMCEECSDKYLNPKEINATYQ